MCLILVETFSGAGGRDGSRMGVIEVSVREVGEVEGTLAGVCVGEWVTGSGDKFVDGEGGLEAERKSVRVILEGGIDWVEGGEGEVGDGER